MSMWIPITLAAAFAQNLRSALQKHLKGVMGTTGATFVRFGFGLPFALLYLALVFSLTGEPLPDLAPRFWPWLVLGALSQILATFMLVYLFSFRNFVVGTAYSRTGAIQTAIVATVLTGASFNPMAIVAILVSVTGVMCISVARTAFSPAALITSLASPAALIGIFSGTAFAFSAVGYRQATLAVMADSFFLQAAMALVIGITFQTLVMLVWMVWRDRAELAKVVRAWKPALPAGLAGATASFGWFAAFTLQEAAIVKTLAQVEILFTFAASYFWFGERLNGKEYAGCGLIIAGIIILLTAGL
ncbi:MAG: EamA family transporter [Pseudomonadota bacterium]